MPKLCPACGASFEDTLAFCPTDGAALRPDGGGPSLVGSVIAGRYLVTEPLGEGGMGMVYLGRHVRLPQQVAIKVMRPEMLADPTAIARFNREAATAASIQHERVVRVYDFGETAEGLVYLAMEFVPGESLKAVLAREGALAPARTAALVRQVAEGLEAAHRMGLVHRDLKPDNILVVREADGREQCKVLDFGIAKAGGAPPDGERGLTRTGFVLGTPEYMSPEQVLGESLDARSDVYALALVAFECLAGTLPFETATPDRGMMARLMHGPRPLPPPRDGGDWPAALQPVLDAALARDREGRTASAWGFAQALADALAEPLAAEAKPMAGTPPPPEAAGAAPVAADPPAYPAPSPPTTTSTPSRAAGGWRVPAAGALVAVAAATGWMATRSSSDATGATAPSGADSAPIASPVALAPAPALADAPPPSHAVASRTPRRDPSGEAPDNGPTPSRAPARGVPAVPATASGDGTAPRRTLDRLKEVLVSDSASPAVVRRLLPAFRAAVAAQRTAADSTWALLGLGEAHLLVGDADAGCAVLRQARTGARTTEQVTAIRNTQGVAGCTP
jgi:serine/threonine-protein kinase